MTGTNQESLIFIIIGITIGVSLFILASIATFVLYLQWKRLKNVIIISQNELLFLLYYRKKQATAIISISEMNLFRKTLGKSHYT